MVVVADRMLNRILSHPQKSSASFRKKDGAFFFLLFLNSDSPSYCVLGGGKKGESCLPVIAARSKQYPWGVSMEWKTRLRRRSEWIQKASSLDLFNKTYSYIFGSPSAVTSDVSFWNSPWGELHLTFPPFMFFFSFFHAEAWSWLFFKKKKLTLVLTTQLLGD